MKSQFVKISTLKSKSSNPEQQVKVSKGRSGAGKPSTIPFDKLHAGNTLSGQMLHAPGEELQPRWEAQNSQSHSNVISSWDSIAEQSTLKQQAMIGTRTVLAQHNNKHDAQAKMLAYGQIPASPYQSGITPFAAMNASSQTLQAPQPSVYYPGLQPIPTLNGSTSPSQALLKPMTLSPMSMNYQGAGGHPPVYSPLPPGPGKPGQSPKKQRFPNWARIAVSVLLLLLVVVGGIAGYYYYNFSSPVSHIIGQQVTRLKGDEDPNATRNGADILSGSRINILLLGSDTDQKFTNADGSHNYLAQSDILITIDPETTSVGMLSIPRDFWINVPGNGMHKLDEAYSLGGTAIGTGAYSPGGVALSRLTIFQDFGIPINYYAWVGLDGFVKVINTVGGVDVDVLHPIIDDNYPDDVGNRTRDIFAYKRLYIPPGPQHLSGTEALEYVRSRHADLVGDFGRSARQQQVLSALKTKLNNPDIVSKLPEIANDLNGYVKTDMQLNDVLRLMNFAHSLNSNSIHQVILGPPYSAQGLASNGQSVVFPDCGKIVPVIAKMFDLGNKAACNIQANSGNNTLASASRPTSINNIVNTDTNGVQAISQMASASTLNLNGGSDNLSGFHSLLDLMFMVALESPQAMQA